MNAFNRGMAVMASVISAGVAFYFVTTRRGDAPASDAGPPPVVVIEQAATPPAATPPATPARPASAPQPASAPRPASAQPPAPVAPPPASAPAQRPGNRGRVAFSSDFTSGTGRADRALRDTGRPVPWDVVAGNGRLNEVIPSTGLDFPTANVLRVMGGWRGSPPGAAAENPRLNKSRNHLPVPEVGGSIYYRWYIRVAIPNSYAVDELTHPIQDGTNGSVTNWQFEVRTRPNDTWELSWNVSGSRQNPHPNNRWFLRTPLNKNQTYRIEMQIHRIADAQFNLHVRVYDSGNTLLYGDAQFTNANRSSTLAANPALRFFDVATLAGFQAGFNGLSGGRESDYPVLLYYQAAFGISGDDWLGPYTR